MLHQNQKRLHNKFFHGHFTSSVRPNLINIKFQSKFKTTKQILWSYFSAPTNILFLSTNLLGLGIISTYRLLSTISTNSEIKPSEDNVFSQEMNLTSIANREINLFSYENSESMLSSIDTSVFENMEEGEEEETQSSYFVNHNSDFDLPTTEMELNSLGLNKTRSVFQEYSTNLIINQLLSVYYIENCIKQLFDQENGMNLSLIGNLSISQKEIFVSSLINLIENPDSKIDSFESIMQNISMDSFLEKLRKSSVDFQNKLFYLNSQNLSLDYLENHKFGGNESKNSISNILNLYSHEEKLNCDFLLELSSALINKSINDEDYLKLFKKLNSKVDNENFKIFGNILSNHLLKSTRLIKNENILYEILKNSIINRNKLIFNEILDKLNISKERLVRKKSKKSTYLIRKITEGSSLQNYSYALNTYLLAIKGLHHLNYEEIHIIDSIKKLFKSLTEDKRITYFNNFNSIDNLELNFNDFEINENIDSVLLNIINHK
ncbi:hypothetical protein WICMUC_005420 [Wickerhamomyces mucosus]|uniref:Uncharacterized protein n=1 Tax=Wickerhamomyces mucosus TaxID=1378264 RepID=A0A9P8P781_9ASCO|nr:hypothetical protein WICMUC_005420 [Wickerhamomyces mucosus]